MAGLSRFQREAQKAYEKGEYAGALAILDKALASSPLSQDEALAVLDLRVSIFLKLDDKVTARKNATQMIRTNRADGRGYLRLGQLERLARDYAAAMVWYDHGLKKVPESDRRHASIIVQRAKTMALLKAQTVLSKPVDPFAKLPAEIVEMVVSFFNYREAVLCLRVSKMWRDVFSAYSVLRNTLDFSHVGKGRLVSFASMKSALRRSQKGERPVLVIAANLTYPAARYLKQTIDRWIHYTKMRHFEVNYPVNELDQRSDVNFQFLQWHRFNLHTVMFGEEHQVDICMFYKILQSCEGLEKASFMSLTNRRNHASADAWVHSTTVNRPNLVSLIMRGVEGPGGRSLTYSIPTKFFARFAGLQYLTFRNAWLNPDEVDTAPLDLSSLNSLRSFDCSKLRMKRWPLLPASLEILDCTEGWVDDTWPMPANETPFANLRVARLAGCSSAVRVLDNISRSESATLTYLDLDLNTDVTSPLSWASFLHGLRSGALRELTFLRIWSVMLSDGDVDVLVEHCQKLETVELSSPNITGVFLVGLLTAPQSRVERLSLTDCTHVSPDTYDWANQRGIIIERTTSEAYGGSGRRVHALD